MMATTHWPVPREGMGLSIDRFLAIGIVISREFGGSFRLSFFAILDIRTRKTTLRLDTS